MASRYCHFLSNLGKMHHGVAEKDRKSSYHDCNRCKVMQEIIVTKVTNVGRTTFQTSNH